MNGNNNPQRNKRLVLAFSGAIDALIGVVILIVGLGFFPIDIAEYGIPQWVILFVGGFMFIMGAWVAIRNYSRMDE